VAQTQVGATFETHRTGVEEGAKQVSSFPTGNKCINVKDDGHNRSPNGECVMKPLLLMVPCLVLLLNSAQDDVQKELARFQGTWAPGYVEIDGKELKADLKEDRLVIMGNSFVFTSPKSKMEGKFKIDPSKKPRTIDQETTSGDNKGIKTVGIYEVDDKRLMVCYRVAPQERPTEFATAEKSGRFLIIYKRVK
jgi:uncharacterized protein (TIGR03067 family)